MSGLGGAGVSEFFFYYESKFKIFFFRWGGGGGGGARVSEFFQRIQRQNLWTMIYRSQ